MDANGKVKKNFSSEEISKTYWKVFQYEEPSKTLNTGTRKLVPSWVKKEIGYRICYAYGWPQLRSLKLFNGKR